MTDAYPTEVTVVRPGEGQYLPLSAGFGAIFKLFSEQNGGELAIVEHPFEVGVITPPHVHTREDEHSFVLAGQIGFRSEDQEVVLGPGGYITKARGRMHAMWNAGKEPGRIIEIITPGGFENYFWELGELIVEHENNPLDTPVRELPKFTQLADKYGLSYGKPEWLDDVIQRYGLNPPGH